MSTVQYLKFVSSSRSSIDGLGMNVGVCRQARTRDLSYTGKK